MKEVDSQLYQLGHFLVCCIKSPTLSVPLAPQSYLSVPSSLVLCQCPTGTFSLHLALARPSDIWHPALVAQVPQQSLCHWLPDTLAANHCLSGLPPSVCCILVTQMLALPACLNNRLGALLLLLGSSALPLSSLKVLPSFLIPPPPKESISITAFDSNCLD